MRQFYLAFFLALFAGILKTPQVQGAVCDEPGTLARESFVSGVTSQELLYTVYLPPCYQEEDQSYPMLTLLHGSDADDRQWVRLGFFDALEAAIRDGRSSPIIVVMPYGGVIANQNNFGGSGYDAILLEFLDKMAERYRANDERAIGGISRGGFWAYHLGLRFADDFVAIGGHSPFFDTGHVEAAYNPLNLAETLGWDAHPRIWLDRGSDDYAAIGVEQMRAKLLRARVPHEFKVYSGGSHSEESWSQYMDDYVSFYAGAFQRVSDISAQPSVDEQEGVELWLPAAGFGALLTSIDSAQLEGLLTGEFDERMILSESNVEKLGQLGFSFHPNVRTVADNELFYALWRDKLSFTLLPFDRLDLRIRPLWVDDVPVVDRLAEYPLVFSDGIANYDPQKLTRITLSGTTALARHTLTAMDLIGLERAASGIRDYVMLSDFFQITHEASISRDCPLHTNDMLGGYSSFCMKRDHAQLFELLDVDVVDLTGNHINDFGYEAFLNTLDLFDASGYALVGGGRSQISGRTPLIIQHNGSRIGWLACNAIGPPYAFANDDSDDSFGPRPGAANCHNDAWLRDALAQLAADVDLVLLTVQYREYDVFQPLQRHLDDYRAFAEWGADIVVGTAEHKPMTFEFYQTRRGEIAFIHYGLGNLFFDQLPWGNRRFFMDTLYIYDGQLHAVELFPGIIDDRARPRLLTGEDLLNFLHFMFIQKNRF